MAVALLPAAVVLAASWLLFRAGPTRFIPVWTDEIIYWHEAAAFAAGGFGGGYFIVHEQPAPASFSNFGPHGPLFPMFHGTVGRLAGWRPYSAFLINLVIVSGAALWWLRAGRAGPTAPAILLIATFWPLLLYLPTNMQEPTHFALAFAFAVAIDRSLAHGGGRSVGDGTALLLIVAILLRPTWALMLLPIGIRSLARGWRGIARLAGVTAAALVMGQLAYGYLAAPYPNSLQALAAEARTSPVAAAVTLLRTAATNVTLFFQPSNGEPTEVAFRYFTALLVIWLTFDCWRSRQTAVARESAAAALGLVPILIVVLLFGWIESWRDFRVLAPHVLTALLVLTGAAGYTRWAWMPALIALPFAFQTFGEFHQGRFTSSLEPVAAMRSATTSIEFVQDAPRYANTLLVAAEQLQYPLLGVQPGIGISFALDWEDMPQAIRTRYLILRPKDYEALAARARLVPIADTPLGWLYRNDVK